MSIKADHATQHGATVQNRISGQGVAKISNVGTRSPRVKTRSLPKTHVDYWRARLEHRCYTHNGKLVEVSEWSVRIKHDGIRKSFPLGSANKDIAAAKAKEIYFSLVAKGWTATLAQYCQAGDKPASLAVAKKGEPTIGDFLAEVERTARLKARTLRQYSQYLRMLAAHIRGVSCDPNRYDYRNGGLLKWRAAIDSLPLAALTPEAAANWKLSYLARGKGDPQKQIRTNRSFNSALRSIKSLFAPGIIYQPNFKIVVPKFPIQDGQRGQREAFWFEPLRFEKAGSMKFHAPVGISFETLLVPARRELKQQNPGAYQLLLLTLCGGLRRAEADTLLWQQLDPTENAIRIEPTRYHQPKHDSSGTVFVEPALMKELLTFKATAAGPFVVNSMMEWKQTSHVRYRCEPHWRILKEWLAGKGLTATKKIHELRKLFGDAIVKQQGIFAGAAQLRHSSIQMTANHYTDPRQRAALPVSALLNDAPVKVVRKSRRSGKAP